MDWWAAAESFGARGAYSGAVIESARHSEGWIRSAADPGSRARARRRLLGRRLWCVFTSVPPRTAWPTRRHRADRAQDGHMRLGLFAIRKRALVGSTRTRNRAGESTGSRNRLHLTGQAPADIAQPICKLLLSRTGSPRWGVRGSSPDRISLPLAAGLEAIGREGWCLGITRRGHGTGGYLNFSSGIRVARVRRHLVCAGGHRAGSFTR